MFPVLDLVCLGLLYSHRPFFVWSHIQST